MECDRKGCTHIMCNRMISFGGNDWYICDECHDELETVLKSLGEEAEKGKVIQTIMTFMKSPPFTMWKSKGDPLDILKSVCHNNRDDE